jgi:hypothetical protein
MVTSVERSEYLNRYVTPKIFRDLPSGCWLWQGRRNHQGYGLWREHASGKNWVVHRLIWELFNDQPVPDGLQVCHTCDNPPCCNPEHLWIGTATDNAQDKVAKGRWRGGDTRGELNGQSKLTEPQVVEIRRRVAAGETRTALALEFGVHLITVSQLVRRLTWRHVA